MAQPIKNWLLGADPAHSPVIMGGKQLTDLDQVVNYLAHNQWPEELSEIEAKLLLQNLLNKECKQLPSLDLAIIHEIAPNTTWSLQSNQSFQAALKEVFINALSQNQVGEAKKLYTHLDQTSLNEILEIEKISGLSPLEQAILISNAETNDYIYTELKESIGATTFPEPKDQLINTAPQRWVAAECHHLETRQLALDEIKKCRENGLSELDLKYYYLHSLPGFLLLDLPNLRLLDLNNNKLTSFTIPKDGLTNLEGLRIDTNGLTSFTIPKYGLTNLKILSINTNNLTRFTTPQGSFTNLEQLSLDYNPLLRFEPHLDSLKNLVKLSICHVQLKQLPEQLVHCPILAEIKTDILILEAAHNMLNTIGRSRESLLKKHLIPELDRYDENFRFEDNFCQLLVEQSELMQNHAIKSLQSLQNNRDDLNILVHVLYSLIRENKINVDTPLGQEVIHYKILLSSTNKLSPWSVHQLHKERLESQENLSLPYIGGIAFNYHAMVTSTYHLPEGVNFNSFQGLLTRFKQRFNSLDDTRKALIIGYLNATLDTPIQTIDNLVNNVKDPWWALHLNAESPGESTWKLMNAVAYIDSLSSEFSQEMPDQNFLARENLLSPKERALLNLLGQVRNCTTGKEGGLDQFLKFIPGMQKLGGSEKEKISEAIRFYLNHNIISTNAFLDKLHVSKYEPLHQFKFIKNRLSKELRFPLEFDINAGTISRNLYDKPPQELLNALFAEVVLAKLYQVVAESLGEIDWTSKEGVDLYNKLQAWAPKSELYACCNWDDDGEFAGINEKGVPYLLKGYGFFQ